MPKFRVSWSTEAWHYRDVEADSYGEAAEAWSEAEKAKAPRQTYQEDITDKWFAVECIEDDEDNCPSDDAGE